MIADAKRRDLRDIRTMTGRVKPMRAEFGTLAASALTEARINRHIDKRETAGIKPATLTSELTYLKQAFLLGQRRKLVHSIPPMPRLKFNNARQGFFEREEFERLVPYLPFYLQDFARFLYWSSWREMEVASLQWRDIEGDTIRLRPDITKTSEGRLLILTGEIGAIIERRRAERLDLVPWIFHRNGHQLNGNVHRPFKKACKDAGIDPPKLPHDLRRTAVRNMVRAGVPERTAMAISGHKTRMIFDRYNIQSEDDIREAIARTQAYVEGKKVVRLVRENQSQA